MTHRADTTIPADDPARKLTLAQPDDPNLSHIGLVGDILYNPCGRQRHPRSLLSHRHAHSTWRRTSASCHDFEEMFSVPEGEIEASFRGRKTIIRFGETINIPANAPHQFQNKSGKPARLLPVLTGRPGRVFQGSRRSRRNADNTTAPTR